MGDDACTWFGESCSGAQAVSAVLSKREGFFVTFWSAHNSDMYWGVDIDGENGGESENEGDENTDTMVFLSPLTRNGSGHGWRFVLHSPPQSPNIKSNIGKEFSRYFLLIEMSWCAKLSNCCHFSWLHSEPCSLSPVGLDRNWYILLQ
jgi:hypothetical protein